jgi:hypothetical protein
MLLISLVAGLNTQMDKIAINHLVESLGYYIGLFTNGGYYCWYIFSMALLPDLRPCIRWGSGQASKL